MKTNSSLRWPKTLGAALAALWLLPASSPALILPVRECHQEQTQWCWAACSQSVLAFYGTNVSQGYIAWYGTGGMNIPNWLYGSTNELRGVDEILSYFGGIPTTGIPSYVPMEAARAEIATNGRPGIIEWTWSPGEGSHALVFHGLEGNMAYLMDPWYGPTINVYGWVVQGYTDIEGGHIWTGTLKLNSNPGTISVSPVTTSFGQIEIGNCVECPFVVSNAGPGTVCGSASVSPPFSVVSGSPYTNAAHQSRLVAARYCPVANETNSATVSFTGGGGAIRQVSGSGYSLVTVSGRITNQLDGVQMIEVPVTFWNGTNRWGVTTTDHQGNYSRQFHSGWTGTVTPNAPGYEFTPPFRCYNCITSDWAAQDFAGYTPKGQQYPDLTSNALEVFADTPSILADDFLCRLPGPISGVTLWGSWTNNVVDTNAIFRLALWSNGPTSNNLPSQPDQALYAEFFYPPTWVADTAVRYSCRPEPVTNGKAFFYPDRNLVSTNRNPQLWRYDFYPPITDPYSGPRWRQDGTHVHPKVYWLSANVINDTNNFRFGWRTSPRHLGTNAVFGHTTSLGDWQALRAPPNQQRLDLAFELRTFPTVSCGKTLKSPTGTNADCLEIVLEGIQEIVRHADDLPPWPNFTITYTNGNTVLDWCGKVLTNGAATQIAFEIPGTKFTILSMGWLAGGRVVGTPHQANFLLPHGGGPGLIYNDLASSPVYLQGGFAEYHIEAVPLAHLNPLGVRTNSLMTTFALPAAPLPVPPSQTGTFSLPEAPANAQYLVLVLNLGADAINPATVDYLQFPLDTALRPTVESIDSTDTSVTLIWSTLPGRTYRVQHADVLSGTMTPEWVDEPGDVYTEGYNVSKQVPIGDAQRFYRVILLP